MFETVLPETVFGPFPKKGCFWVTQRARGSKKIILARTHEKTIPPRTKFSFSHEIFILDLKISFSIENFNPRPCFSAARKGPGMKFHSRLKISFRIESLIFSILPLEIEFFQSWGPLGKALEHLEKWSLSLPWGPPEEELYEEKQLFPYFSYCFATLGLLFRYFRVDPQSDFWVTLNFAGFRPLWRLGPSQARPTEPG